MSTPRVPVYRDGEPLTPEEFVVAADHIWLNAFQLINPSDEFAAQLGHAIIAKLRGSDLRTAPLGDYKGSQAVVLWLNAS